MNETNVQDGRGRGLAARPIRVLHLEDSTVDAEIVQKRLQLGGLDFQYLQAPGKDTFESALKKDHFDLILCDHGLPGYDGFEALEFAKQTQPQTPIIVLSGELDDEQAVKSLRCGAIDYVLKQRLARLLPAVHRALREAEIKKAKDQADRRLREQASLLNMIRDAIIVRDMDDKIMSWSHGAEILFGWTESEAVGQVFAEFLHCRPEICAEAFQRLQKNMEWVGELLLRRKNGDDVFVFNRWSLVRDGQKEPQSILSVITDITDKKKMEAVFLRSQRMDSIGALAGGIAHDLNNALAPVMVSADLLKMCRDDATRQKFVDIISSSAHRATGMVQQILGFARGSGASSGPIHLKTAMREMAKIVRETFPKSIAVNLDVPDKNLSRVKGDATELHQILMNLCVNARDAMPNGGALKLSARSVTVDAETASKKKCPPGPFVKLTVADSGAGIPEEVLPRIFEPFFTTKLPDKGTGLGLSTVATLVKQWGGFIDVTTDLNRGTEFHLYLPALLEAASAAAAPQAQAVLPAGRGELILVLDDESAVRELAKSTLESYGYRVLTAENGVQGITLFEEHANDIALLVSDTDMPVMDGIAAIQTIRHLKPNLPAIVMSGGPSDTAQIRRARVTSIKTLAKPFSLEQLLTTVDSALPH